MARQVAIVVTSELQRFRDQVQRAMEALGLFRDALHRDDDIAWQRALDDGWPDHDHRT